MRILRLFILAIAAFGTVGAFAQDAEYEVLKDQYCEICPYDAPVSPIRRLSISAPSSTTTVITPEDMQALGVVPVADMIKQLEEAVDEPADTTELAAPEDEGANEAIE